MPRIIIDTEKCKNCGICIETCPNNLIGYSVCTNKQGNITAEFNDKEGKCTGCSMCALMCPEIAIKEVIR
ncbi:MAG: 4Fe-4S binding protein [bacterium]|nr:4Fe-4S binding protein [bacterium]